MMDTLRLGRSLLPASIPEGDQVQKKKQITTCFFFSKQHKEMTLSLNKSGIISNYKLKCQLYVADTENQYLLK
jgi:hypothetical protein